MSRTLTPFAAAPRVLAAAALGLSLGACVGDRHVTGSTYPADHRVRHPIIMTDAPRTLDVFVTGPAGLDRRQAEDVRAFAAEYRRGGRGPIVAQVPSGPGADPAARRTLDAVRHALADGGVPGGYLQVAGYQPTDPAMAAPVRLSFHKLQAKVASECGLWPQDLGAGDYGFSTRNEAYWNHGCAVQSNVAQQIADPIDLARSRPEDRPDTIRRMKNIEKLREGQDPSTEYRQDGQNKINQQVAN